MNASGINEGGYEKSEMRKYLVPVTGDDESGNFLTGLTEAGVPDGVLWGPARALSKGENETGSVTLSDKLWLPTEREMFQDGKDDGNYGPYSADSETEGNQARLAYYADDNTRLKAWGGATTDYYPDMKDGYGMWYWMGSAYSGSSTSFCTVPPVGGTVTASASYAGGVAPAFCVK
jgi:hypothetical protein